MCVLVWSRIGWGQVGWSCYICSIYLRTPVTDEQVVQKPHGRSYDAAWLSQKVLGVLSDDDGLETHEVTHVWPLVVEKRTNFFLPMPMNLNMFTLSVSVCAVRPTKHFAGRHSFYDSLRAREHLPRVPRETKRTGQGIVVIAASASGSDTGKCNGYTLVVTVSYIMALALSEQDLHVIP